MRSDSRLHNQSCLQLPSALRQWRNPTRRQHRVNIAPSHPDHLGILYTQKKPTVIVQLTSSITILGKSLQGRTFLRLHEGKQYLSCSRNCLPNPYIYMHTHDMKLGSITSPMMSDRSNRMLRDQPRDQPQQRRNSCITPCTSHRNPDRYSCLLAVHPTTKCTYCNNSLAPIRRVTSPNASEC